jgi:hypothetical protein
LNLSYGVGRRGPLELADLFHAFDVSVTHDKLSHSLELAATVTAELVPAAEKRCDRLTDGRRIPKQRGGIGHTSATAYRFVEIHALGR